MNLYQFDGQVASRPFVLPAMRVLVVAEVLPLICFVGSTLSFFTAIAIGSDLMLYLSVFLGFGFFVGGVGWLIAGRGAIAISMCALQLTLVSFTTLALIFALLPHCPSSGCVGSGSDDVEWRPVEWAIYLLFLFSSLAAPAVSALLLTQHVKRRTFQPPEVHAQVASA